MNESVWGKLAARYEGSEDQKHKILALDGGGMRGLITLEVLARIEEILAQATGSGPNFRLCHFFDYIGGTSTGAIIATGLARGMTTRELIGFFEQNGRAMFDKQVLLQAWNLWDSKSRYSAEPLKKELQGAFGVDTTLKPDDLECLLLAVTRNHTTDSPWPITSNPQARYNDVTRMDCNLNIPLWQIVRASTAAPSFFPPEVINWDPEDNSKAFVFVDGAMTPYNNPAFLLYRMATHPAYNLGWAKGEDKLLVVSVGTGSAPKMSSYAVESDQFKSGDFLSIPNAYIFGAMVDQDTNCRDIGRCVYGAPLDREVGDMIPRNTDDKEIPLDQNLGRHFLYARYNADLSREGLDALGLQNIDPEMVQKLDSVESMNELRLIGLKVAAGVRLEHFGSFV